MTIPVILHRESFGYGPLIYSQLYVSIARPQHIGTGDLASVGAMDSSTSLKQWGRGTGADQGWAAQTAPLGIRTTTLGFPGSVANGVGICVAFNQGGHLGGSSIVEFWDDDALANGSFSNALLHLCIGTLNDGRIVAYNGANGGTVIGAPGDYVVPPGANIQAGNYTHFEIIPVIHSSAGSVVVYADGVEVLNLTSVATRNTQRAGTGKFGYVQLCGGASSKVVGSLEGGSWVPANGDRLITDLVVTDGSSQFGDHRVTYRKAAVAGTYTDGTAVGAGTLLACVSEQQTETSKYIAIDDSSLPKAASFTTEAMPADAVSIDEVSPLIVLLKDDANADTTRALLISGGTTVDHTTDYPAPTGYNVVTLTAPGLGHQTDPNTSAAWTIPNCDAVEIGSRRTA